MFRQTKERPVPPNQAFVSPDEVTIKSWNNKEKKYSEFTIDYASVYENLKSTSLKMLYQKLANSAIDDQESGDESKPDNPDDFPYKMQPPKSEYTPSSFAKQFSSTSLPGNQDEKHAVSSGQHPALVDEEGGHRPVKGPKKRLTQIPRHDG